LIGIDSSHRVWEENAQWNSDSEYEFAAPSGMAAEISIHCRVIGVEIFRPKNIFPQSRRPTELIFLRESGQFFSGGKYLADNFWGVYPSSPQPLELGGPFWGAHESLGI